MIDILDLTLAKDKFQKNKIRKAEQYKQFVYYSGDLYNMKLFLEETLGVTYKTEEIMEMQKNVITITKKIVKHQSVVYSEPAVRSVVIGDTENAELSKYLNKVYPINCNTSDKMANRLGNLSNTSITHVKFSNKYGKFIFRVVPSYHYDVEVDEDGEFETVAYSKLVKIGGVDQIAKVIWEKDRHYYMDSFGNKIQAGKSENFANDFKVIPFADFVVEQFPYYWGEGQNDLINVNEQINFLLTKLINSDIIQGTEGIPIFTNMKESVLQNAEDTGTGKKKIKVSRRFPIFVDDVQKDEVEPNAKYLTTNPHIEEIMGFIDWYVRLIASMKGLSADRVLGKVQDTSDYQKIADMVEQIEIKRDSIDSARQFEIKRFNVVREINNQYKGTAEWKKFEMMEIPDNAEIRVQFADIEIQKTVADQVLSRRHEAEFGLATSVDWLLKDKPYLSREKAEELIKNNKKFNDEMFAVSGGKNNVRDFLNSFDKTNRESLPLNRGGSNA